MNVFTPQDMRFNLPTFDAATIAAKVADEYGLTGEWAPLVGERDQNFRLSTDDGHKFVVKIAVLTNTRIWPTSRYRHCFFWKKAVPRYLCHVSSGPE